MILDFVLKRFKQNSKNKSTKVSTFFEEFFKIFLEYKVWVLLVLFFFAKERGLNRTHVDHFCQFVPLWPVEGKWTSKKSHKGTP